MQFNELKNTNLDFYVKVTIAPDIIIDENIKELTKVAKKVKLDGFRTGKAPIKTIEKKYGSSIKQDVIQNQVTKAVQEIIKEKALDLFTTPKIEELVESDTLGLEFVIKFELNTKVSIPDFKLISLERPILKIDDKDIGNKITELAESLASYSKETEKKAKKNDQVTIDAVGYIKNEPFDGGKLEKYKLVLGSKSFIDNFEDQLIGHKVGDEILVKVTFPIDYQVEHLAGQAAEFQVKISSICQKDKLEIDEEFVKKLGLNNLEELKQKIALDIKNEADAEVHIIMKKNFFNQLEKILTFDVPQSLLHQEYVALKDRISNAGELETFQNKSEEELDLYYNKLAMRRVRIGLILSEYVQSKNIIIETADIHKAILAQIATFPNQEKAIIDYYQKNPAALESLKGPILEEKAIEYIFQHEVQIVEKEYNSKQLEQFLEQESNVTDFD
jgi:trigger factor